MDTVMQCCQIVQIIQNLYLFLDIRRVVLFVCLGPIYHLITVKITAVNPLTPCINYSSVGIALAINIF